MRRALPVIALSAAGLTWLLRAQGVIDANQQKDSLSTGAAPASGGTTPVDGTVATTPYGPVQVAAVVKAGRLDDVRALQLPEADPNSKRISAEASPKLREAAVKAQSARIDTVAGATFTSDGYRRSLQSALDEARVTSGSGGSDELAAGSTTSSTEATTSTTSTTALLLPTPPPGAAPTFPPGVVTTAKPGAAAPKPTTPPPTAAPPPAGKNGAVTRSAGHQYATVTVTVTFASGQITSIKSSAASKTPNDTVSPTINSNALPTLDRNAMSAKSANIAGVSGATLTTNAYKQSLQAALA